MTRSYGFGEAEGATVALGETAGTLAAGATETLAVGPTELETDGAGLMFTEAGRIGEPAGVPPGIAELAGAGETDAPGTGVAEARGAGVAPLVNSRVRLLEVVPLCA